MAEEKETYVISAALDEVDAKNLEVAKEMTAIKSTSDLIRFAINFLVNSYKADKKWATF